MATDAHALWNRCEPFEAEAPEGVALITAGVDVQADRLEMEIAGWGRDEESWSIAYHVIPGDVTRDFSQAGRRPARRTQTGVGARLHFAKAKNRGQLGPVEGDLVGLPARQRG